MPYKMKTARAGSVMEITKYHSMKFPSLQSEKKRREKIAKTAETQKKINERLAEEKLRLSIMENFKADDYYITLTYETEPMPEDAKKNISSFIRKIASQFKKNRQQLRYIAVTEYGSKRKRIHHHILIGADIDISIALLKKMWPQGHIHKEAYQGTATDAERLADYFIKKKRSAFYVDPDIFCRRWMPSRNLKKPRITKKIIPGRSFAREPKPIKGYYIDKGSIRSGETLDGYPYQFYRMIKIKTG